MAALFNINKMPGLRIIKETTTLLVFLFLFIAAAQAQTTLSRAEYFFDTDPGLGRGTGISVSPGVDSITGSASVSLSGLVSGPHILYLRTAASSGIWGLSQPYSITIRPAINYAEYFVDADPGVGLGTPIGVSASTDSITFTGGLSISPSLSGGLHYLFIRTRTDAGKWGLSAPQPFVVNSGTTIGSGEWFIDNDPGLGNGTAFSFTPGIDSVVEAPGFVIPGNISGGLHFLYIRTQTQGGEWGLSASQPFVANSGTSIASGEWFIDNDPGIGNGTAFSFATGLDSVSVSAGFSIPSNISGGLHFLFIRTMTQSGGWGLSDPQPFNVNSSERIDYAEYFLDTDPGFGMGTSIPVTAGLDSVTVSAGITVPTGTSSGAHDLYIRTRTHSGAWGFSEPQSINVIPSIVAAEYFFDVDPGVGNGSPLTVTPGADSVSVNTSVIARCLDSGAHYLFVRTMSSNGQWGITQPDSIYVNIPAPQISSVGSNTICTGDSVTFTVNTGAGCAYQWLLNSGPIPGANGQSYTGHVGGSYQLKMTTSGVDYYSNIISITTGGNGQPPSIDTSGPITFCAGGNIVLTARPNAQNAYHWSTTDSTQAITVTTSGSYAVTITDTTGCNAQANIQITVNPNPTASASVSGLTCQNGNIQLNASGGATYSWSGPSFTLGVQNPVITNAQFSASGVYTVTVTDTNHCTASDTASVNVHALPPANASNTGPYCADDTVRLDASGGTGYSWSGPSFTSAAQNPVILNSTNANSGIYTVTVTDANSCTTSSSTTVTVYQPSASIAPGGATTFCAGDSVTLTADSAASYLWSNGSSNQSITVHSSGTYSLTITDSHSCTALASQAVTVNSIPTPSASHTSPACAGGSVTLNASGGSSYSWSSSTPFTSSQQNPVIDSLTTANNGSYTVTVSNGSCSATAMTTLSVNPLPILSAGNTGPYCAGNTLQLSSSGGTGYSWSGPNSFSAAISGPSRTNAQLADSGVYTVTVTDANGCSAAATTNVLIGQPSASIIPGGATTFCAGDSVTLTSGAASSYVWSNGSTDQAVTVSSSNTYSVTVTDSHSCSASASQVVTVNPVPTPSASHTSPVCAGGSVTLNASGGSSYSWSSSTPFTSSQQNPVISSLSAADNGTYTVTVSNGSCSAAATTSISVDPLPIPVAGNTGPYCAGNTVQLSSFGGVSYSWSGPNSFSAAISGPSRTNAQLVDSGSYTVTVTDTNGCSASANTNVTINGISPSITAGGPVSFCQGGSVTLSAHPTGAGYTYDWSTGASASSITVSADTTYTVTVHAPSGCTASASQSVTVNPLPTVSASNSGPYCVGYTIQLNSSGSNINTYHWSGPNGFSSSAADPTVANSVVADYGTYHLTVTSASNCTATASTVVSENGFAPYFSFTGDSNYVSDIVYPDTSSPYNTFYFEVTYYSASNTPPAANYPRLELDFDHDGLYTGANDRVFIMQQADANDTDYVNGKVYFYNATALPAGGTYWTTVIAYDNSGASCYGSLGVLTEPTVLNAANLEILASDITFSAMNPDTSAPLQVCATIHNTSNYPAYNFVNHLQNQYDTLAVYPDITVPFLAANSSTTICWNIVTPNRASWDPMEVTVNSTQAFPETNWLDNEAIRPFTCGNFIAPGYIQITAAVNPQTSYATSNNELTVCGYAEYENTAVKLNNPSVAGATVTLTVPSTGATYTTYTNSQGYYCFTFTAPVTPGLYDVQVTITDFTVNGDTTAPFALNPPPCLPDLYPDISLSAYTLVAGQSITGTYDVASDGCANVLVNTLTTWTCTGANVPSGSSTTAAPFNAGATQTFSFPALTFDSAGVYTICVNADASNAVVESNESNTYCRYITVLPNCADLAAGGGPSSAYLQCNSPFNVSYSVYNAGGIASDLVSTVNLTITSDSGAVIGTYTQTIGSVPPLSVISVSFNNLNLDSLGAYNFFFWIDTAAGQCNINDKTVSNTAIIYPCVSSPGNPITYLPSLSVYGCNYFSLSPADPLDSPSVGISAIINNGGNAPANGPFIVSFDVDGAIVNTSFTGTLAPGASTTVSVTALTPPSPGGPLVVTANSGHADIGGGDSSASSNSGSMCFDFYPSDVDCQGYVLSWIGGHVINQPFNMGISLLNGGLYTASQVHTLFEIEGPGLPAGWNNLGFATTDNVAPTCYCPYYAALPTPFALPDTGIFYVRITVNYDRDQLSGRLDECDTTNNVIIIQLNCSNVPDYQVLSQDIAPSLLNPAPGQAISIDVTYENLGQSDIGDSIQVILEADNTYVDTTKDRTLASGDSWTTPMPNTWSSTLVGLHVFRAILNADGHIDETNYSNNQATRSIIVGSAPHLYFSQFTPSDPAPAVGQNITFSVSIPNEGDQDAVADVLFKYVDNANDTVQIYSVTGMSFIHHDTTSFTFPWTVLDANTYVFAYIVNCVPTEYTYDFNTTYTQLGALGLEFISTPENCIGYGDGHLTVFASGGVSPYTYSWSNGGTDSTITAGSGVYTVTVTDHAGITGSSGATIGLVPDVTPPLIGNVPTNINYIATNGVCPAAISWSAPVASDNCGLDSFYSNHVPGDSFPVGTTTVIYRATDFAGNLATASFTVTVIGLPLNYAGTPESTCGPDTLQALAAQFGMGTWSIASGSATFANSNNPHTQFTNLGPGVNEFIWTITNGTCGSSADTIAVTNNCSAALTVSDSVINPICGTGSVYVTAHGGTTPYSYHWNNGDTIQNLTGLSAGTFYVTVTDHAGATAVNSATITVRAVAISTITQSICQGSNYDGHIATGTYVDTLTGVNGCDSIRTLNLTVRPISTSSITQSICQGSSYLGHSATGTYHDTLTGSNGCDSIRTLNLTVKPITTSSITQSICQGGSYLGHSATGTYHDTLAGSNGCDSVRTLNLTVKPFTYATVTQSICQGSSYDGHSANGTYVDTLTGVNGCDSIRTLNLTVNPLTRDTITAVICSGSSYTVGTQSYNATGTYYDTLTGINGCDSIVTLHLTVSGAITPSVTISASQLTICSGGSVTFTATPSGGGTAPSYQWYKDGIASGTNSATYTATGINNNDSIWVVMTSNSSCASPLTATSSNIKITINCGTTTWTGTTSTNWLVGTNWTAGVPSCSYNAIIPTGLSVYPVVALGQTASVDSVTIQTGASLTVTGTLDVCGGWSNSGTASVGTGTVVFQNTTPEHIYGRTIFTNLTIAGKDTVGSNSTDSISVAGILQKLTGGVLNTANKVTLISTPTATALIQEAGGALNGKIWMQRYMGDSRGYHHLSSPVTDATVGDWAQYFHLTGVTGLGSFIHGEEATLQEYLEGSNHSQNLDSGYYNYSKTTQPLTSGLGLSQIDSTIPLPKVLTTYGTPAHGNITITVSRNGFNESNTSGWNFIGNPYPSPISWTMLKGLNQGIINGSCYIWKPTSLTTGSYQTYNGTAGTNGAGDVISSSQGFWILDVQGSGTSANLTFADTIRTTTVSAVFYKAPDQLDNEVDIAITDGTESDEIIAYTQPGASDGFDAEVDGVKSNLPALASNMSIAYKINGLPYSIHVTDNITPATVWPLEISTAHDGIYNITPNTINVKGLPVYLLDNTSGRYYDLNKETPALSLTGGMKDDKSYAIVFDKPSTTADNSIRIYSYGDQIYVNRTSGKPAKIRVTNLLGQEIAVLHSETNNSVINVDGLQASCVIVYVEEDGGGLKQSAKLVLFNDK